MSCDGHPHAGARRIEATRQTSCAQPSTRVLTPTTFGLDGYVFDALRAGASGFMLKDAAPGASTRRRPHRRATVKRCSPRPSRAR